MGEKANVNGATVMSEQSSDGLLSCGLPHCHTDYGVKPAESPPGIVLNGCELCRDKSGVRSLTGMSQTNADGHRVLSPRAVGKAIDTLKQYDVRRVRRVEIQITTHPESTDE